MSENIELQSFNVIRVNDDEIEEYHEIDFGGAGDAPDNLYLPKPTINIGRQYDFFTDQKNHVSTSANRKKGIKKDVQSDLLDVIKTELASNVLPLKENVIECIKSSESNLNIWLYSSLSVIKRLSNYERRLKIRSDVIKLAPIFPKVLENTGLDTPFIPVQYVQPVKFEDLIEISSQSNSDINSKFLNIALHNYKFRSHHLFSLETLLSRRLLDGYDQYTSTQKALKDVVRNLKVNRFTRDNLKQEFTNIGENSQKELRCDPTIRKFSETLFNLKEQYIKLVNKQKELVHEILSLWSDIRIIRDKSGETEIPIQLEVVKYLKDTDNYNKEWTDTLNLEIADLLDKIEYDYVTKYLEYKENKSKKGLSNSKVDKIRKPNLDIDENEVKKHAETITNQVVSKDNNRIFIKEIKSKALGSNQVENIQTLFDFCFKFYIDNIFICESDTFRVTKNNILSLNIEEYFSVQILTQNTTLTIGLCENGQEVSLVQIDLKGLNLTNDQDTKISKEFFYDIKIAPDAKYIGSGHTIKEIAKANKVRLKSSNFFKQSIETVTEVEVKTTWDRSLNRNEIENIKSSMEVGNQIQGLLHGVNKPNLDILKNVINHVFNKDIDTDEELVNQLQQLCKMRSNTEASFHITEDSEEYTRLKLLHLRNSGGFLCVENKMVPLHASQVSTEQLNCLDRNNATDLDFQYLTDYENADPIEMQRFVSAKYVQNLNKNILKHLQEHLFKKTQKDVLKEVQDFRGLFSNHASNWPVNGQHQLFEALNKEQEIQVTVLRAFNLMDRSSSILDEDDEDKIAGYKVRPLRPFIRVSYRGSSVQTATGIGCFPTWNQTVRMKIKPQPLSVIFINIYDEFKSNIKDNDSNEEYSSHSRTVHYRYCNRWMGAIEVPLYSVLSLGTIRGTFKISTPPVLFGYENAEPRNQNHSFLPEVNQLMKKDLSFLTLQISSTLSNLGGLNGYNQPLPGSAEDDYIIKHLNNFVTEYLNDFPSRQLSLTFIESSGKNKCVTQFLQPIPLPGYENFPRNPKYRTESALSKSSGMSKSSSSKSSAGRRREIDVEKGSPVHEEKESVYSAFEGTWKEDGQLTKLMNTSLRYVALIPTYEVNITHAVTLMGLELLKLLHGSPLDHTILLASYLLYLGIKSYIAIGTGLPRGSSSFVLTQFDLTTKRMVTVNDPLLKKKGLFSKTDGFLWYVHDACSGEKYELRDVSCPMKTVNYVFDNENIWVNIQQALDCEHVYFDFSKSSDWQPVFDNSIFVMKQPIVTDLNLYSTPVDVEQLQGMLDSKIRAKLQKWRPNTKTVWNRYCSNLLREALLNYEYWLFNPTEPKPPLGHKLKQLMLTHKVFGFPLNMSYVNTKSVIAALKRTGIYNNEDPQLEFGVGVQVYAYPNNVFSVWVYVASISRI